jgi:hypothetical protein
MPPSPPSPSGPNDDPDAPKNKIKYFGRFEFDSKGHAHHGWNGLYIKANFDGTAISCTMKINQQACEWDVIIDGKTPTIVTNRPAWSTPDGFETLQLASGLSPGKHSVELRKRSESRYDENVFGEFSVSGGSGLLKPDPVPDLALEFFGDSWLSGHGAGFATSHSTAWPAGIANGADSYGPVAARALGAEYHLQAYGGMSWSGRSSEHPENMVRGWSFAKGTKEYNVKRWKPDIVVIDMGRNDGHGESYAWKKEYDDFYDFIAWCQSSYGHYVPIVIVGQDNYQAYHNVYDHACAAGSNVYIWTELLSSDLTPPPLVDGHPSKTAHERFAKKLQTFLETEVLPDVTAGKTGSCVKSLIV